MDGVINVYITATIWDILTAIGTITSALAAVGIAVYSSRRERRLRETLLRIRVSHGYHKIRENGAPEYQLYVDVSNDSPWPVQISFFTLAAERRVLSLFPYGKRAELSIKTRLAIDESVFEGDNGITGRLLPGAAAVYRISPEEVARELERHNLGANAFVRAIVRDHKRKLYVSNAIAVPSKDA